MPKYLVLRQNKNYRNNKKENQRKRGNSVVRSTSSPPPALPPLLLRAGRRPGDSRSFFPLSQFILLPLSPFSAQALEHAGVHPARRHGQPPPQAARPCPVDSRWRFA